MPANSRAPESVVVGTPSNHARRLRSFSPHGTFCSSPRAETQRKILILLGRTRGNSWTFVDHWPSTSRRNQGEIEDDGVLAERRAAREDTPTQVRQRQFREAIQLLRQACPHGVPLATRAGRGQGDGGAPPGAPG